MGVIIAFAGSEMADRYASTISRYQTAIAERMARVGWLFPMLLPRALYVFNLSVAPDRRGCGVGTRLLTEAASLAQSSGLYALTSYPLLVGTAAAVAFAWAIGAALPLVSG